MRNARSLSLADVAEATGISASFLSLVENNRSDITIGRLVRLIDFYGISITDLLPFAARPDYPEVIRPDERRSLQSPVEGIDISTSRMHTTPDRQMMPLEVCSLPARGSRNRGDTPARVWLPCSRASSPRAFEGAEPRVCWAERHWYYPAERPHLPSNARTRPLRVSLADTPPTMYRGGANAERFA